MANNCSVSSDDIWGTGFVLLKQDQYGGGHLQEEKVMEYFK